MKTKIEITISGESGTGKTTVSKLIAAELLKHGYPVQIVEKGFGGDGRQTGLFISEPGPVLLDPGVASRTKVAIEVWQK